jgi:DeoR/GlpR family transcriptional regulator of sugar metabolism
MGMLTRQRKDDILMRLTRDGQVVAKHLSQEWGVSEDTVRRDLRELAAEGLLQRVHGGALPASPALAGLAKRQSVAPGGKSAIARAAAAMVAPGQVLFLDGGTTAMQVARQLPPTLAATVVTHSPGVAVELASHPLVTVELVGGRLYKHSVVSVGAAALEALPRVRPDLYFMGVTGVHPDYGLTTGDAEEAAMKRAICHLAAETVVLASSEKLGAVSPCLVVPAGEVAAILVDGAVPEGFEDRLIGLGVNLLRTEGVT